MSDLCSRQEVIIPASRTGELSAADREHVATCAACADALLIQTLIVGEWEHLQVEAAPAAAERVAPILWRRLAEDSARRARRLTAALQISGVGLSVVGFLVAAIWGVPRYGGALLAWFQPALVQLNPTVLVTHQDSVWGLVAAVAGLGLAMLTHSLWSSWAEAD
jgi:hypothetical protein